MMSRRTLRISATKRAGRDLGLLKRSCRRVKFIGGINGCSWGNGGFLDLMACEIKFSRGKVVLMGTRIPIAARLRLVVKLDLLVYVSGDLGGVIRNFA
jgi:hypothetical protein